MLLRSLRNLVSLGSCGSGAGCSKSAATGLVFSNNNNKFSTTILLSKSNSQSQHGNDNNKNNESVDDDDDIFGFNKSSAAKANMLSRFGLVKPYAKWPQYNRIVYPPQSDGKPTKNPYVHHMRNMIKYPAEKLWFPAFMIRGMTIDEAIKQLSFHKLKGAAIIKEVLLEAQELAVQQHNIEFKSNLWISYSSTGRAMTIKGVRKHRGPRVGIVEYKYSNYYVRLEEGKPPANFNREPETYESRAKEYMEKLRKRTIHMTI